MKTVVGLSSSFTRLYTLEAFVKSIYSYKITCKKPGSLPANLNEPKNIYLKERCADITVSRSVK